MMTQTMGVFAITLTIGLLAARAAIRRWAFQLWSSGRPSVRRPTGHVGRTAGLVALTLVVAACGGGGGGGHKDDGQPPPSSKTVTGAAAKGLLANAIVTFNDVTSNGTVGSTVLGTTRTNSQGAFSVNVTATGPIVATLTVDATTTMLDELSGVAMPAPAGLTMHAALSGVPNTPIAITPLTEMAYGIASAATGGLTVANIDAANSAVSAAMLDGAPILSTLPIDLADYMTATVAQQAQAKLLTAMAVAADDGTAIGASGTSCDDADYDARLVCMVGGLSSLLTSGASNSHTFSPSAAYLVSAYLRISGGLVSVAGGQTPAALGMNVETTAEASFATAVASQAVLFGYDASASPLVNTKALFADLRTNIIQLKAGQDAFGVTPILADMQADYKANVAPTLGGTRGMLVAAYTAAGLIKAGDAGSYKWGSGGVVCGYDPALYQTATNVALCSYSTDWDEQILLKATEVSAGTYQISTQPMTFDESGGFNGDYDPIFNPYSYGIFAPNDAIPPVAATLTSQQVTGGTWSESWNGQYYVTIGGGRIDAELNVAQSQDWDPVTISGTLSVSGALSNGAGGIELTEATIGSDSQIVVQNGALGDGPAPSVYGAFSITRLATSAFVYAARASIGQPVYDLSGSVGIPRNVAITGSVGQLGDGGVVTPLFSGRVELALQGIAAFDVTQPIDATNSFVAQLQVVGSLALSDNRVLAVSVAASASQLDPTPDTPHSLSATYAYTTPAGMARINVSGTYNATDGYQATVTTNAGVTANLSYAGSGKVQGTVTANGVETATINGTTIQYSDGSTESVF
jgi:hypothetical protein